MEKRNKIIYYVSTGLFSLLMLFSATMYFIKYDEVVTTFNGLGFPAFVVIPLAIAKILGLVAIWTRKSNTLLEWAYGGFLFNLMLAAAAHINAADNEAAPAIVAIGILLTSYFMGKKLFPKQS